MAAATLFSFGLPLVFLVEGVGHFSFCEIKMTESGSFIGGKGSVFLGENGETTPEKKSSFFCLSGVVEPNQPKKFLIARRKGWRFLSELLKNTTRSLQSKKWFWGEDWE